MSVRQRRDSMSKAMQGYDVFLTSWGWASMAIDSLGVRFLILPEKNKEDVVFESEKMMKLVNLTGKNNKCQDLIQKIIDYFNGIKVDFSKYQVNLSGYTTFQEKILQTVKEIPYGETLSYKEVAEISGYPGAYRAVGSTMRHNNIPLIIPCHRVIKSDNGLGGFSARGGIDLKKEMLNLESC